MLEFMPQVRSPHAGKIFGPRDWKWLQPPYAVVSHKTYSPRYVGCDALVVNGEIDGVTHIGFTHTHDTARQLPQILAEMEGKFRRSLRGLQGMAVSGNELHVLLEICKDNGINLVEHHESSHPQPYEPADLHARDIYVNPELGIVDIYTQEGMYRGRFRNDISR